MVIFISGGIASAQKPNYPTNPQGYVNDYANVISPEDKDFIGRLVKELEEKTTDQMAVVTINSTQPETIEGYAVELFKRWGIGQKGKDNGVLLLIAVQDRTVRIETGYGLEGIIPDVIANKIILDRIVPSFKSGDYSTGIKNGTIAIISVIAKEKGLNITGQESQITQSLNSNEESSGSWIFILIIIVLSFILRGGWWWLIPLGMYGGGSSRGGGFSGGSGGFGGGFGGGMSGGGGASGRW